MNPSLAFSASLVASLVLWLPTMLACLRGELGFAEGGLRYVAAFLLSRLAVAFLGRLVAGYRAVPPPTPAPAPVEEAPRRRRDDDPSPVA